MKKVILAIGFLSVSFIAVAQDSKESADAILNNRGMLSLGVRNSISLFNTHTGPAFGAGGQFRIQLSDRVNTEWYADFINSNIEDQLGRTDAHIGWSVMYYVLSPERTKTLQPYIEAGHCFDYTFMRNNWTLQTGSRWSSAVQMGLGVHFNITPRFDFTLKTQYMLHLGEHIEADKNAQGIYEITNGQGFHMDGHWLTTLSINYKIFRIWKR